MIGPVMQSSGLRRKESCGLTENETVRILALTTGAGSKELRIEKYRRKKGRIMKKTDEKE